MAKAAKKVAKAAAAAPVAPSTAPAAGDGVNAIAVDIEDVSRAYARKMPALIVAAAGNRVDIDAVLAQHNAFDRLLWEARAARLDNAASGFASIAAQATTAKTAAKAELQSLQSLVATLQAVNAFLNLAARLITEFRV